MYGPSCELCAQLAADEINAGSGILGRELRLVTVDGAAHYVYTAPYEHTPGVFLTGETPDAQILPAMRWMAQEVGVRRWCIVGNNYVWPRRSAMASRRYAQASGAEILDEIFLELGTSDFDATIRRIERSECDGVLMFLVGNNAVHFNRQFADVGLDGRAEAVQHRGAAAPGDAGGVGWQCKRPRHLRGGPDRPLRRSAREPAAAQRPRRPADLHGTPGRPRLRHHLLAVVLSPLHRPFLNKLFFTEGFVTRTYPTRSADMPVPVPDQNTLTKISDGYGLGLSTDEVAEFNPIVTNLLGSFDRIEEIYNRTAPAPRSDRKWHTPSAEENPLGGWYVQTEISKTSEGPLAGRTVAIKDNTQVAGVPMMDGPRPWRASSRSATPRSPAGCSPRARRSRGRPSARTCTSPVARTPRAPATCATRGTPPARRAARRRAARRWSPPAPWTSPPAVTRAARSGCRRPTAASSGTSPPTPRPLHRRLPDRADPRPRRPDDPHRRRRRAGALGDRRARRARPAPAARPGDPGRRQRARELGQGPAGRRSPRASASPGSPTRPWTTRSAPRSTSCARRASPPTRSRSRSTSTASTCGTCSRARAPRRR
jgi:ABC-type branched-chain amino acid transport systems, periplasmic component